MRALSIDECMLVAGGGDAPPQDDGTITVTAPSRPDPVPTGEVVITTPWGLSLGIAHDSVGGWHVYTGVGWPTGLHISNQDHADDDGPNGSVEAGAGPGAPYVNGSVGTWEPVNRPMEDRIQTYIDAGMPGNIP